MPQNAFQIIPKKKSSESYENTSTHTQILPPPPPSTADTLSSPAKPNTQTNDNYKQKNIRGLVFNPIKYDWELSNSTKINYFCSYIKS